MASELDFPAKGKVTSVNGDTVVFVPTGTSYEMQLKVVGGHFTGAINKPIEAIVRMTARKVMTVPSGGNFVTPIFGPPRIVQGRVRFLSHDSLVLHAGTDFTVQLPASDSAFDLAHGAIAMGSIVNATIMPGATFELVQRVEAKVAVVGG